MQQTETEISTPNTTDTTQSSAVSYQVMYVMPSAVTQCNEKTTLPKYYKESFFSGNKMFHPELQGGRMGVAGDPIPYTIAGDNIMTSIIVGCLLVTLLAVARLREFLVYNYRNFFHAPSGGFDKTMTETSGEITIQIFLMLQASLLFGIIYFLYANSSLSLTFITEQYTIIGAYSVSMAAYFLLKFILYIFVNPVFFSRIQNIEWLKTFVLLTASESVLVFPVMIVQAYFDLSMQTTFVYTIFIVIMCKLLAFYKSYAIFFKHRTSQLQNILYFCALEMMPLAFIWSALGIVSTQLTVNI